MPTVISKFLERTDQPRTFLTIPSPYIAGALIGTSLLYYVGYPVVKNCLTSDKKPKLSENNNSWKQNGVSKKENNEIVPKGPQTFQKTPTAKSRVIALASKIPALNLEFINQFLRLLRIMMPGYFCKETFLLSGHTIFLLLRTFLSIYVANMEGAIVKYIVRKDAKNFAKMLLKWFSVALPATFINSMIRYLESKIALSFR